MSETLRVLQVEDSESDAALIVRLLEKAGYDVRMRTGGRPRRNAGRTQSAMPGT